MKALLCLILSMCLLLEGCWDQKVYEKTGFILQVGIEGSTNENKLTITYSSPVVEPKAKEEVEVISSDDENLLREFREDSRKISSKLLEGGKIQQILISDSLATKGISSLLEVFEREPTNPSISYVVIVEGSPKEMIEKAQNFGDKPRPAYYLNQLIQNNIQLSYVPEMPIYRFTSIYFSPGIDPIAPFVSLQTNKGKGIEVTGSALFSGDKYVGKIDTQQTMLLLSMMGKLKSSVYIDKSFTYEDCPNGKRGLAYNVSKVKRKLDIELIQDTPTVNIKLNYTGSLGEFHWNAIPDEKSQIVIEEALKKDIENNCKLLLKKLQSTNCDALGVGDYVRAKYNNYWKSIDWYTTYPTVKFNVNVKVTIGNHGVIN